MALKSFLGSRQNAITVMVFLVAFVICGIAWMRFFSVVAANPSPVRYVDYVTPEGVIAPFRQDCAGPSVIENDAVWRFCEYAPEAAAGAGELWGLARFDLVAGTAQMLWPLPEAADAQLLALGKSPQGDLAVAWGAPDLHAVYLILLEGGVVPLGVPEDAPGTIVGMAWIGDVLEIVAGDAESVTVYVNESGVWQGTRAIERPPACADAETVCTLQIAHRVDAGWRSVYAIAPRAIQDQADADVSIVAALEDGTPEPVDTIRLAELDPSQYTLDERGDLVTFGALFDRSPGNVVNWSLRAAPFVLHGGTWERVAAPQIDARFYFSDYALDDGGLRWIPGTHAPQRSWQVDQWVTLRSSGDDIFLAELNGARGDPLARNAVFSWQRGADIDVLPASDGGYWVLGPHGAYVKATADYARADGLNVVERVVRTFENFGRLDDVSVEFYREWRVLKMAAFPLVLLSLPAGYVLVFAVRQSRQRGRDWLRLLVQISAVYVLIATVFIWWFWELMNYF